MKLATPLLKTSLLALAMVVLTASAVFAQLDENARVDAVKNAARQGESGIPVLAAYIDDPSLKVRLEAVKRLVEIGGPQSVQPLLQLTRDNDPEVEARATDGLVNVYVPGYIRTGISGSLKRAGDSIRAKFDDDADDLVVPGYVMVPEEVIEAMGRLARGGTSMATRANAARAVGILRGRSAVPDLIEALYSKDDDVMKQALIALQKIRDPEAGPQVTFVLRDLNQDVQVEALELVGILRTQEAAPEVRNVLARAPNDRVEREALTSLAMIGSPDDHDLFIRMLTNRNEDLRSAAAEGLARIANPDDLATLNTAYNAEGKDEPRLAMAFALVAIGQRGMTEYSPLRDLVNSLNTSRYRNIGLAYLTELARNESVRQALYPALNNNASRDEKTGLAIVFGRSGGRDSLPYLQQLAKDPDAQVAEEAQQDLRTLQTRLG